MLIESAPAKVNLTLRVLRRRADGYHELESLVAFARFGDRLTLEPAGELALAVRGPMAADAGEGSGNLVLKAARELAARVPALAAGAFVLEKRIPVAAGLGGGSADAAAALRLLARANRLALDDPRLREAALATGADVLVCLDPRPRIMRGIGDVLSAPLALPLLPAVLVNPGVGLATRDVFTALASPAVKDMPPLLSLPPRADREAIFGLVAKGGNDLEAAALRLCPTIADVLAALRAMTGCRLARMSGSGATCFGLFGGERDAALAARDIAARHPGWWVQETAIGDAQ